MEIRKFLSYISILFLLSSISPPLLSQGRVAGEVITTRGFTEGTGVIFFVDDSGTDEGASNGSIATPFGTIDYAVGRCGTSPAAASTGCTIYAMPGHAETLSAADAVNIDVAGISLIGLGRGGLRPSLSFTGTTAAFSVEAADVEIANFEFVANVANHVNFIDLQATADGAYIHDNLFREGSSTGVGMIDWSGIADDVLIENNTFYAPTAGNYNAAILMASSTSTRGIIRGNHIHGDFDDAGIHNPTSNVSTLFLLEDNTVINNLAGAHAIELVSAVTGTARNNVMQSNILLTSFDPGSMMTSGNTWTSGVNVSAQPSPADAEYFGGMGYRVTKDSDHSSDPDDLFLVTGTVFITLMIGEVETGLSASHSLIIETDADIALCASTTVDSDIAGTLYLVTGDFTDICSGAVTAPALTAAGPTSTLTDTSGTHSGFVVGNEDGTVVIRHDVTASETGVTRWVLFYIPISPGATVAAAA